MLDDDFMLVLWTEHHPYEGKNGMSVCQLQNLMRDTIQASNAFRVHVGTFFSFAPRKKTPIDIPRRPSVQWRRGFF